MGEKEDLIANVIILVLIRIHTDFHPNKDDGASDASRASSSRIPRVTHFRPRGGVSRFDRFIEHLKFWRVTTSPTKVSDRQLSLERDAREVVRITDLSLWCSMRHFAS